MNNFSVTYLLIRPVLWPSSFSVCGERIVTDKDGILKYPTSEDLYAKNESCVWVIEFPKNEKIVVNTKMIEIEAFRNFHCVYDYLEIRDGRDESAPMVGRFCGKAKPPVFTTSSNYLYVKFLSDPSLQQKGFEIHYSKNEPGKNRVCDICSVFVCVFFLFIFYFFYNDIPDSMQSTTIGDRLNLPPHLMGSICELNIPRKGNTCDWRYLNGELFQTMECRRNRTRAAPLGMKP